MSQRYTEWYLQLLESAQRLGRNQKSWLGWDPFFWRNLGFSCEVKGFGGRYFWNAPWHSMCWIQHVVEF